MVQPRSPQAEFSRQTKVAWIALSVVILASIIGQFWWVTALAVVVAAGWYVWALQTKKKFRDSDETGTDDVKRHG